MVVKNNFASTEMVSSRFVNNHERNIHEFSKVNNSRKHTNPISYMSLQYHENSKSLPYYKNSLHKIFQKCHKCRGASTQPAVRQENTKETKYHTTLIIDDEHESKQVNNVSSLHLVSRIKRETEDKKVFNYF